MAIMTVRTTLLLTNHTIDVQTQRHVHQIISNVKKLTSALNLTGFVMETMIVVITQMKIHYIVLKELAHKTASGSVTLKISFEFKKRTSNINF